MSYNYKDKPANVAQSNRYMLAKTLTMFEWDGLPDSIPRRELEFLLQTHGFAFITEVDGTLYAFHGGLGGVPDVYNRPTEIVVANPALKLNRTFNLERDGVLIENDEMRMGLMPLLDKFNTMLAESDINMTMNGYLSRMQTLITASDDRLRESAERYLKKLVDGELGAIGEKTLFDGIKLQTAGTNQSITTALIEHHQYIKASLYHEIGLDAPSNMKRDRLVSAEVESNHDALYPFVDNMMACRLSAVERLNAKYDLSIEIDYGSVWSRNHKELVDGAVEEEPAQAEGVVDQDGTDQVEINDQVEPLEMEVEDEVKFNLDEGEVSIEEIIEDIVEEIVEEIVAEVENV